MLANLDFDSFYSLFHPKIFFRLTHIVISQDWYSVKKLMQFKNSYAHMYDCFLFRIANFGILYHRKV